MDCPEANWQQNELLLDTGVFTAHQGGDKDMLPLSEEK